MSNTKGPKWLDSYLFGRVARAWHLRYNKKINHSVFLLQLALRASGSKFCNFTWFVRKYPLDSPDDTTHFSV